MAMNFTTYDNLDVKLDVNCMADWRLEDLLLQCAMAGNDAPLTPRLCDILESCITKINTLKPLTTLQEAACRNIVKACRATLSSRLGISSDDVKSLANTIPVRCPSVPSQEYIKEVRLWADQSFLVRFNGAKEIRNVLKSKFNGYYITETQLTCVSTIDTWNVEEFANFIIANEFGMDSATEDRLEMMLDWASLSGVILVSDNHIMITFNSDYTLQILGRYWYNILGGKSEENYVELPRDIGLARSLLSYYKCLRSDTCIITPRCIERLKEISNTMESELDITQFLKINHGRALIKTNRQTFDETQEKVRQQLSKLYPDQYQVKLLIDYSYSDISFDSDEKVDKVVFIAEHINEKSFIKNMTGRNVDMKKINSVALTAAFGVYDLSKSFD